MNNRMIVAYLVRRGCAAGLALVVTCGTGGAESLENVVPRIKPSVVGIGTYQATRSPRFVFSGTGFIVGDGNLVATNAHVLTPLQADKMESLVAVIPAESSPDRQRRELRPLMIDKEHDLALLRLSGPALPALQLARGDVAREGQSTAFTGFPIGSVLGLIPVTHRATISAITPIAMPTPTAQQLDLRTMRRLQAGSFQVLQLDATAYPGNSGSPLYDASTGEVIGIVNLVFVKATKEAILSQPSGISFAMPVEYLHALLGTLK